MAAYWTAACVLSVVAYRWGVIGVIYEARPNVTVDVASLCLKTGNAVILRGGKETCRTNAATVAVIQDALKSCGLPAGAVQAIDNPDRALVSEMLRMDKYIDMLIPRGGAGLHKLCREQSTIPVITGGIGVCHIYVDESVEIAEALKVIVNAKTQRPSTCNTVETLLVNKNIADSFPARIKQTNGGKRRDITRRCSCTGAVAGRPCEGGCC